MKAFLITPVCTVLALLLFHPVAVSGAVNIGSSAEWLPATEILVHSPGDEIFLGVLHPGAALFERPFSLEGARREHLRYVEQLRARGITVHSVVEVLLAGTESPDGHAIEGQPLRELRSLAAHAIRYDASALAPKLKRMQPAVLNDTLSKLSPRELVRIVLERPRIVLTSTGRRNTGLGARYEEQPLMNLYFMRDAMITTGKGVVIAHLSSEQRRAEVEVVRFVLKKLGLDPLMEVGGTGRLEGGDFIPAGEVSFIGQGLRTNAEAVRQLLDRRVFGSRQVVVVKDPWLNQEQMHLDTYFNVAAPRLAVLVETRLARGKLRPKVDVYDLDEQGRYQLSRRNADFPDYLEKELGYRIIAVSKSDQLHYGVNFLTVAPGEIIGVDGVSPEYKHRLEEAGVKATWLDFTNLTGGYGAAHCMTQVLHREKETGLH